MQGRALRKGKYMKNQGKLVLKTVMITVAVLAFVPTVFVIKKGKGFDGYGLLSHLKYEKKPKEGGGLVHDVTIDLIDLQRYGIDFKKIDDVTEVDEVTEDVNEITE